MELINSLIDSYNLPLLTAFLLGVLTSISPCPLTTNIAAVAFISKDIKTPRHTILSGLFYTLGRGISYTLLAILIYFGLSSFQISNIFQGWGDKVLGPVLIIIGLVMFGVIKINLANNNPGIEKIKLWLSRQGYIGSLALGILFALAFCPYSGVLFFGVLIPMVISVGGGLALPIFYALGTGLPVMIFAILLAFSLKAVGKTFDVIKKIEKWLRYIVASVFILAGLYYLRLLAIYLFNLY